MVIVEPIISCSSKECHQGGCLRQNQMQIPEFVPEVALLQRFTVGDLEMFQARESLQHGEVGRAWFVQAGDHGIHGAQPSLRGDYQLCPAFAWMRRALLVGYGLQGTHNRCADSDDAFSIGTSCIHQARSLKRDAIKLLVWWFVAF